MRRVRTSAFQLQSNVIASLILLLLVFLSGGHPSGAGEGLPGPPAGSEQGFRDPSAPEAPAPGLGTRPSSPPWAGSGLAGRLIVLDPGHGGTDPGAPGASGDTWEKYNTLFIALDAKALLERAGARVVLTRTSDVYVSLAERVRIANQAGADAFVSVHNDWNANPAIRGVTTYYHNPNSRALAEAMQGELVEHLGARNVGVIRRAFYVVRNASMPAVLLELGFLSHRTDEALLADPAYRYRAAEAIYRGLSRYFDGLAG
ncbi:MAG: N-acetylmuramoyl-L-alanine amidase [Firmicutes bacterium]|nr:N-acetylmuramoyl-L-alanine amidase [Bacillota bacterium]